MIHQTSPERAAQAVLLPLCVGLVLASAVPAQTQPVVVPAANTTVDGSSLRRVGGFDDAVRQQLLVGPQHLSALAGDLVTSIALRPDVDSDPDALFGGDVDLRVWLSTATTQVEEPSPVFAANRGADRTLVFDGVLSLPSLPARTSTGVGSPSSAFAVQIPCDPAAPFVYLPGTTLLVEFEGRPVPGSGSEWWPVDAVATGVVGTATPVGSACGATSRTPNTAFVDERELVLGRTMRLGFRGAPSTPAVMAVSVGSTPNLLPLPGFGDGCGLHILPPFVIELGAVTGPTEVWPGLGAQAEIAVPLEADPILLGLAFSVQWFQFGPTQAHFSNALDVQVATAMPDVGMALVEARATDTAGLVFPADGNVDTTAGLVVCFGHTAN